MNLQELESVFDNALQVVTDAKASYAQGEITLATLVSIIETQDAIRADTAKKINKLKQAVSS